MTAVFVNAVVTFAPSTLITIVTLHGFYLNSGTEKDSRLTALILIFLALEFMPHLHNRK